MKYRVGVQNLKCGGCANTITREISKIEGVENVMVDADELTVEFESEEDKLAVVYKRLKELGYPLVDEDNPLLTQAKSFVSCAIGRVTK